MICPCWFVPSREDRTNAKLERYMDIKMPFEKPSREKEPPKTLVKVVTSDEFERFVLNNRKQLLAIFCRKGRYTGWAITVSSFCHRT